jgi:tetratricopeptide (TPR) repeat protein
MRVWGPLLIVGLLIGSCPMPGFAYAQAENGGDAEARVHFEAGSLYYETGRYDEALDEFTEAYRLSGRSALLYNQGQALERLERHGEAIDRFTEYLEAVPTSPMRAEVEARIVRLRVSYAEWQQSEATRLAAQRVARREAEEGVARRLEEEARLAAEADLREELAAQGPSVPLTAIVSWSASGALVIGAISTGIMAAGIHRDLEEECGASTPCPPNLNAEIERGERLALVSDILSGLSILGTAAGLTFWLLDESSETPTRITLEPTRVRLRVNF